MVSNNSGKGVKVMTGNASYTPGRTIYPTYSEAVPLRGGERL